jgi:hypothetical protein
VTADDATTEATEEARVARLRGAGVEVNGRAVATALAMVCVAGMAIAAVLLALSGAHKNAQIATLQRSGVPVTVTVTDCTGQLGGSGSNSAGVSCTGSFTLQGHTYVDAIPGAQFQAVGSSFQGITVPSDPALLSTPALLRAEQSSWRVYLAPAILGILAVAGVVVMAWRHRRKRPATSSGAALVPTHGVPTGAPS